MNKYEAFKDCGDEKISRQTDLETAMSYINLEAADINIITPFTEDSTYNQLGSELLTLLIAPNYRRLNTTILLDTIQMKKYNFVWDNPYKRLKF